MFTKYTWSKMRVALSICPKIKSISLSINSLYSLRLQLICCSSSLRICKQKQISFSFLWHTHPQRCHLVHTSFDVMFSRSWNIMMLRSLALIRHSVLSRSVGLHKISQNISMWQLERTPTKTARIPLFKYIVYSPVHYSLWTLLVMLIHFNIVTSFYYQWKWNNSCIELIIRISPHLSTNMAGESGRVVSRSVIAFHSLMQLCSEVMLLS